VEEAMSKTFEAIYENGVLRPASPMVGLSEGQRVWVTTEKPQSLTENERKEAELIRVLEAQGLVEKLTPPPAPADFRPLKLPGPGLSETILAERR
jgi:predicted DNA-binding antitoxin AbrB/MazE fold protein